MIPPMDDETHIAYLEMLLADSNEKYGKLNKQFSEYIKKSHDELFDLMSARNRAEIELGFYRKADTQANEWRLEAKDRLSDVFSLASKLERLCKFVRDNDNEPSTIWQLVDAENTLNKLMVKYSTENVSKPVDTKPE
jgi:hypothetical protein